MREQALLGHETACKSIVHIILSLKMGDYVYKMAVINWQYFC